MPVSWGRRIHEPADPARIESPPETAPALCQPVTEPPPHRRPMARPQRATEGSVGWRGWLNAGFWSVADQGLFSLANLLLSVGLARLVEPEAFGGFSFAYALLLLAITLHAGLLTEPLLVLANEHFAGRKADYLGSLVRGHAGLAGAIALVFAAVAGVLALSGDRGLAAATAALAAATPFALAIWLARRACYARLEPWRAAAASAVYLALLVGSGALLSAAGRLSPVTAFGALAVASVVPAWWLAYRFDVRPRSPGALAVAGEALREHWGLGRWAAASFVFRWLPRNIYFVTLPWLAGLDATAALLAMLNLVAPALQVNIALSTLFIPAYRSGRAQLGRAGFLGRGLVMVGVPSLIWWALAVALREPAVALLYRGRYAGYTDLVWILGALPLLTGVVTVLGSMLFAERRLPAFFWSFVAGSVAAATAGVALAARWGAGGAAAGMLLAYTVVAASMAWTALKPPPAGTAISGGSGAR